MNVTNRIVDSLRSGNLRTQLWAATFGSGFGKQALGTLDEFAKAIDEVSQQPNAGIEQELFLGRAVISMANIVCDAGKKCSSGDRRLVLQAIDQLASDSRLDVIWHVLRAIEILGRMSDETAAKLEQHVISPKALPDVYVEKIKHILSGVPRD